MSESNSKLNPKLDPELNSQVNSQLNNDSEVVTSLPKGFSMKVLVGFEMEPYIPNLAKLRCEVFKEYPYRYIGDLEFEKQYLQGYAKQPHSVLVVILKGDDVVGCASAMPLVDEGHAEISGPLKASGYDINKIFLYNESLIQKQYRGLGFGNIFFKEREKFAKSFGSRFDTLVFFAIDRAKDDPNRPKDYRDLFDFWNKKGFHKTPVFTMISYQEYDENSESLKKMSFWMKKLD